LATSRKCRSPALVLLPSVGWPLRRQRFAGTGFKRSSIWMRVVVLTYPASHSARSKQDLADYLELFLKAKRRADKEDAANRGGLTWSSAAVAHS
jgi:hypothetical protein